MRIILMDTIGLEIKGLIQTMVLPYVRSAIIHFMAFSEQETTPKANSTSSKMVDQVNSPPHYTRGNIEVIEFIRDQKFCYLMGNVIKYVSRAPYKGKELEDLKKAEWYLRRRISEIEKENV